MTPFRQKVLMGASVILLLFVASWWWEHRRQPLTAEQAVAHEQTQAAKRDVARIDTQLVAAKLSAVERRAIYRAIRDSALRDLRDTSLTKRAFAAGDTAIIHDTITIRVADDAIRGRDTVIVREAKETDLALKPRPVPRLRMTVAGLYDPLHATTSAAADVGFRVIGGWQLVARAEQSLAVGTSPRVAVGIAKTF